MSIETILREISLFNSLPDASLSELVDVGQLLSFDANQVICKEGELGDTMYVLLDGQIRVFMRGEKATEIDIAFLGPGDYFGEMALLDRGPRSASVSCITTCQLFVLDRSTIMTLLISAQTQEVFESFCSDLVQR